MSSIFRVTTCNIQRANGTRAQSLASALLSTAVDVLILTEVSAGSAGETLAGIFRDRGYTVIAPAGRPGDRYRVLVVCADADAGIVDIGTNAISHRCVAVRVLSSSGLGVGVVGVYVPSRGSASRRNQHKRSVQDEFARLLPGIPGAFGTTGPIVITGDLNVVEPEHRPHYRVFGQWEYDFYEAFAAAGFDDAFRLCNPGAIDYSWFGRPNAAGQRNGYRFDHVFVTRRHRQAVVACGYDHTVRLRRLTDHAALTIDLSTSAKR